MPRRRRTRRTVRTMQEILARFDLLPADAPPEERQILQWLMREPGVEYPVWRMEVKKQINAEVLVDPKKVKAMGPLGGRMVESADSMVDNLDIQEVLSIENPHHSPDILGKMQPPKHHRPIPTLEQLKESFEKNLYYISSDDLFTVHQSILSGRPLLVSGPPGVGKTELAKQVALAMNLNTEDDNHFGTLFCTPDVSVNEAIYRWNDPKRLLDLQLLTNALSTYRNRINNQQILSLYKEIAAEAYGLRYLEIMSILRACLIPFRTVRLVDEVDKSFPTFDNLLLDIFQRYAFEVPEYGTVGKPLVPGEEDKKPLYVVVSNDTRDLSAMLVSRCVTLWLNYLPEKLEAKVVQAKTTLDEKEAGLIASFFRKIRELASTDANFRLNHPPSTREVIASAQGLVKNRFECCIQNLFKLHAFWIKTRRDYDMLRARFIRRSAESGEEWWADQF